MPTTAAAPLPDVPDGDDLRKRLLATFEVEAEEHVTALTSNLLALEAGVPAEQERELLELTFRSMHTLKGAARSVGLSDVETVCQACELVLSRVVRSRLALTPAMIEQLQDAVNTVSGLLSGDVAPAAAHEVARRVAPDDDASVEPVEQRRVEATRGVAAPVREPVQTNRASIRIDAEKLDALLLQGEELLSVKLSLVDRTDDAERAAAAVARVMESSSGSTDADRFSEARAAVRELLERLTRDRQTTAVAVDRLLDQIRAARMTPASTILDVFPSMVRDLAREQRKEIDWTTHGETLELDRRVLEALKDPLIQLVRNAVDHGIEEPAERAAAGKPPHGRVAISVASREDGRVELEVADDGRGIDLQRVREAAIRARVVGADDAEQLEERMLLELIFESGLSTSPVITELSGHGLGLAIVRDHVERISGELEVESGPEGTRVRMVVPATIATFHGLLIRCGEESYLLSVDAAEEVFGIDATEIAVIDGRETISWHGEVLPLARLDSVLADGGSDGRSVAQRLVVVVASAHDRVALLVDDVLGEQEVLVKEFAPPLVRVPHVAGAGVLGSGRVVLILRASDLVRAGRRALRPPAPRLASARDIRAPLVLVVDDAVTTRTMERTLLEAAGYRVEVAVDGADAWRLLKTQSFDLVVSDVDMPRMDGFELTARIRAEDELRDLPIVLVSALESREDKERGVEVGANAYVVKSSFDQSNLLEIIQRLGVMPPRAGP